MPEDPSISRRDLLRGRLIRALSAAAKSAESREKTLEVTKDRPSPPASPSKRDGLTGRRFALPIHRPPGAVDEVSFQSGCTRCGECVAACPVGAIVLAPERFREAAGTPMIDLQTSACIMCADTPCIAACEPGVLRTDRSKKMGVAWVQTMACLPYSGTACTLCSEKCPVPGAMEVVDGKPRIFEDVCTGCGVCSAVCPAPVNAILVMPVADRPGGAAVE